MRYISPGLIYLQLLVAILFNVGGQLLLKRASMVGGSEAASAAASMVKPIFSPWFIGGAASLGLSSVLWVGVLKRLPLTIAHPLTGIVFILVPVASHFLWDEPLPPLRMLGIFVIIVGVFLVARAGT